MARSDPLDEEHGLKPGRFGHAPSLWLALPMVTGCALDAGFDLPAGPPLALAACAALILWRRFDDGRSAATLIVIAGVGLGCGWHQLRKAPRAPVRVSRSYDEHSVRIERAAPRAAAEAGWTGMGVVTDRDGPYHRRRLAISGQGECPATGAELRLLGRLASLDAEPGSHAAWARRQGATLRLTGARTLGELEPASRFSRWCLGRRTRLDGWLRTTPWPDETGGALLAATLLGRTALIPADERTAFERTGTLHLFAISGLHIAGMAAAMAWIARRLRLPSLPAGLAGLALLWTYVQVTGAAPSATRAWIMAACFWAGRAGGRASSPVQSLGTACFITLVLNPEACADAGFQLSYLAVTALVLAGGPAARLMTERGEAGRATPRTALTWRDRAWAAGRRALGGGACVSSAATLAGAPVTLAAFGSASWGGVFANLVLVPMAAPPLLLGMASVACMSWEPLLPVASWLNGAAGAWLRLMGRLAEAMAVTPGLTVAMKDVPGWATGVWSAVLIAILLAQAEATSVRRLLGVPAVALALWIAAFA